MIEKAKATAKSLRWLSFNFPEIENPTDDSDKMCNCIHVYCESGAEIIETLLAALELKDVKYE